MRALGCDTCGLKGARKVTTDAAAAAAAYDYNDMD
jgi:hypothetical protein